MKLIVTDIETTGFQRQGGVITEIGFVLIDLAESRFLAMYNSLVKSPDFDERHTKKPFGWIFENSSMKPEDVYGARSLECVIAEMQFFLDNNPYPITAFNSKFDLPFLVEAGLQIEKTASCIMLTSCPIVNLPPNRGRNTPKWPTVEEAWKHFYPTQPYVEAHRALDDAWHEALIAQAIYNQNPDLL